MSIAAFYFDGHTSRRHVVELSIDAGSVWISGAISRHCALADVEISERIRHAPRKLSFPNGAYVEVTDHDALNRMLAASGYTEPLVVGMQHSWRSVLIVTASLLVFLVAGYLYLLPLAAKTIASVLPEELERSIGQQSLALLDTRIFSESKLPLQRRDAIQRRFALLVTGKPGTPHYQILFRKSKIGANAFALPSGKIVLTDEIVDLVQDDEAVMAILAHELGHLHERHLMRRIIQSSVMGAMATLLMGDVSAIAVNVPTVLLDLKYSREAEREADDYAIEMMRANGISLEKMVLVFEKLQQAASGKDAGANESGSYLSSHPSTAERIERIRQMEHGNTQESQNQKT